MGQDNPFDQALEEALRLSSQHEAALRVVESLTEDLAVAVARKTNNLVNVELVTEARAATLGDLLKGFGIPVNPRMGSDREDQQVRQYLVASANNERRVLWGIRFSDSGYPVTLLGPEEDASNTCFAEEDLRAAFVEAAKHGRVGRKLAGLERNAKESAARQAQGQDPRAGTP
jgi:hypothetical protein